MTAGDLLKAEHVTLDVGTHKQLMEDVPTEKRLVLSFPHISAWVPDLLGPGSAEGGNMFTKAFQKLKGGKPKPGKPKERQVINFQCIGCASICERSSCWLRSFACQLCCPDSSASTHAWTLLVTPPGILSLLKPHPPTENPPTEKPAAVRLFQSQVHSVHSVARPSHWTSAMCCRFSLTSLGHVALGRSWR